jgi:hypothetical protein
MERVIQEGPLQGKRCVVLSVVGDKVEAEVGGRVMELPATEVFGNGGNGTQPQPQSSTPPIKSFGDGDSSGRNGDGWKLEHLPPGLRALFEKREALWRVLEAAVRKELGECRLHMVPKKKILRMGWEIELDGKSFWFPAKGDLRDFRKRLAEFLLRHTRLASRA